MYLEVCTVKHNNTNTHTENITTSPEDNNKKKYSFVFIKTIYKNKCEHNDNFIEMAQTKTNILTMDSFVQSIWFIRKFAIAFC